MIKKTSKIINPATAASKLIKPLEKIQLVKINEIIPAMINDNIMIMSFFMVFTLYSL